MKYLMLAAAISISTYPGFAVADSCFCNACCTWQGGDSCDYTKVVDVPCNLPIEKQKESVSAALRDHVRKVHRGVPTGKTYEANTEIKCYRTTSKTGR